MNPYAPPVASPPGGRRPGGAYRAHRDGDALVVARDASLPSVCMKCGGHQDITYRSVKLQWTPRWARFLIFCGIGIIIFLVTTKRAVLAIPLCPACNARWNAARNALIACTVALIGSFLYVRLSEDPGSGLAVFGVAVVAFVVVGLTFAKPRMLQTKKIDDQVIALKGVHEGAAQEIAEGSAS